MTHGDHPLVGQGQGARIRPDRPASTGACLFRTELAARYASIRVMAVANQ